MILLKKIVWYKASESYQSSRLITDAIDFDSGDGLDIQNNILHITLKNSIKSYDTVGDYNNMPLSDYINKDDTNNIRFEFNEKDQFKVYLKYTDDGSEVYSTEWTSETTHPASNYLIGTYFLTEYSVSHDGKHTQVKLVCADKTYILFNRVLAKSFLVSEGLSTPEKVQKVVQLCSIAAKDNAEHNFNVNGAIYEIDAPLKTRAEIAIGNGGIQSDRRTTYQDGDTGASSTFPNKTISKIWKPAYEWIRDLSQVDNINTDDELSGTGGEKIVYGKPFIFWVDENQLFHWVEMDDTIDSEIIVGQDEITNVKLTKKVFDAFNMLIYNCGTDMNGVGIIDYYFDETSNIKGLKMQYQPMTKISEQLKELDYTSDGVEAANRVNSGLPKYDQYPSSYPLTTSTWSNGATSDSNYNTLLRDKAKADGRTKSKLILSGLTNARWKGSFESYGQKYSLGAVINLTDTSMGLYKQPLRIMDIKHSINSSGWFTNLTIEQDEEALLKVN